MASGAVQSSLTFPSIFHHKNRLSQSDGPTRDSVFYLRAFNYSRIKCERKADHHEDKGDTSATDNGWRPLGQGRPGLRGRRSQCWRCSSRRAPSGADTGGEWLTAQPRPVGHCADTGRIRPSWNFCSGRCCTRAPFLLAIRGSAKNRSPRPPSALRKEDLRKEHSHLGSSDLDTAA